MITQGIGRACIPHSGQRRGEPFRAAGRLPVRDMGNPTQSACALHTANCRSHPHLAFSNARECLFRNVPLGAKACDCDECSQLRASRVGSCWEWCEAILVCNGELGYVPGIEGVRGEDPCGRGTARGWSAEAGSGAMCIFFRFLFFSSLRISRELKPTSKFLTTPTTLPSSFPKSKHRATIWTPSPARASPPAIPPSPPHDGRHHRASPYGPLDGTCAHVPAPAIDLRQAT